MSLYNREIENRFIDNMVRNGFGATVDEMVEVLSEMETVLNSNKDQTIEEIVTVLMDSLNNKVKELSNEFPFIPGYNIAVNSGNIKTNIYGGNLDSKGNPMIKEALFDVASITKLFTQIISYNLIREGYYRPNDMISDLHPKFVNATNLDIKTIMNFAFSYKIDGKIEDANSIAEAKEVLYTLGVNEKDVYAYIDFGMLCLKEVMEYTTGKTYEELVNEYIVNKLELENTYLQVPEAKRNILTGTPNIELGLNNDMKAIKLGGHAGNSGILANSDDLLKVVSNLYLNETFFPNDRLKDVYTESEISKKDDWARAIMGNACTLGGSFAGKLAPFNTSAYQGSTRTQVNVGIYNDILTSSAILFNPASMGLEKAYELEEKLNKKFVTEYSFEGKNYVQMSTQVLLPVGSFVKPMTEEVNKLQLKLAFLNTLIEVYEPNFKEAINIEINNGPKR